MAIKPLLDYNYTSITILGYTEFTYANKAIRLGVYDYLLKPIDKKELNNVIQQELVI